MSSNWLDAVNEIDQDTVEQTGVQYPFIQWVNGQFAAKKGGGVPYTGGLFIPERNVNMSDVEGWVHDELLHRDGNSTMGYFARDISIAVIHTRRRWTVKGHDGVYNFAWNQFDQAKAIGKPTGHLQILSMVKGLEYHGPMVLTVKGMVCKEILGSRGAEGILRQFDRLVIQEANALNKKRDISAKFPYRAFWLTIGPKRDDKGLPIFEAVGQGDQTTKVTLPMAIGLKEKPGADDLGKLFVGVWLSTFNTVYNDNLEWRDAWSKSSAPAEPEMPDMEDLPPMQPPDEEYLPF